MMKHVLLQVAGSTCNIGLAACHGMDTLSVDYPPPSKTVQLGEALYIEHIWHVQCCMS